MTSLLSFFPRFDRVFANNIFRKNCKGNRRKKKEKLTKKIVRKQKEETGTDGKTVTFFGSLGIQSVPSSSWNMAISACVFRPRNYRITNRFEKNRTREIFYEILVSVYRFWFLERTRVHTITIIFRQYTEKHRR